MKSDSDTSMGTTERNPDSSSVNDQNKAPMTNAERQRRYRDRKRGCPPQGRWAGHTSTAKIAEINHISRTMIFMVAWIRKHAPEYCDALMAGHGKVSPHYHQLKLEYDAGLLRALIQDPKDGSHLVERREDGEFIFEWIE